MTIISLHEKSLDYYDPELLKYLVVEMQNKEIDQSLFMYVVDSYLYSPS